MSTQLTAVLKNAAGDPVPGSPTSWHSSDTGVATVSATGLVHGVAPGTATITALYNALTSNAVTVTVPATDAELPRVYLNTAMSDTPATFAIVHVAAGADVQAAVSAAQSGTRIKVAPGARWPILLDLGVHAGGNAGQWCLLEYDGVLPAEGTRMTPTLAASLNLPQFQALGGQSAIRTQLSAAKWRLIGLEILPAPSAANNTWGLLALGDGGDFQVSADQVATDIIIDRCYIHGTPTFDTHRAISCNSARTAVIDSWISEIHSTFDAQGIGGWNGPGPYKIVNNFIEGSAGAIGFGGADAAVPNTIPSDIEIRRNYLTKNLAWKGTWLLKTIIECKNAKRILIEANVMENSPLDGQAGYALVFYSSGDPTNAPWTVVRDLTIRNNVIRNVGAGFQLSTTYYTQRALEPMSHVTIRNNVLIGIDGPAGQGIGPSNGRIFQLADAMAQLTIEHNTGFSPSNGTFLWSGDKPLRDHIIRNNLMGGGQYQIFNGSNGLTAWNEEAGPGSAFLGNVIALFGGPNIPDNWYPGALADIGLAGGASAAYSPTATLADLTLNPGSGYHHVGTDGTDPGADMVAVAAAVAGVGGGF